MEKLPNDNEVVELIVVELVNEQKFEEHINPRLKKYFNGDFSFSELVRCVTEAQDDHTHRLRRSGKDMKYRVAVRVIEYYWDRHKDTVFNRWDIPEEAQYLYPTPKKPEPVLSVDMTEIELRVLSRYADFANQTSQKVGSIINCRRTIVVIKEFFDMYKQGRWAWNTIRGKLEGHIDIDWRNRNDSNTALIDMFVLKFYSKFFADLYDREFTRWDVPPQCRYLFEPEEFENKSDWIDIRGNGANSTRDDCVDALSFVSGTQAFRVKASEILKQASEQNFGRMFKPCPHKLQINFLNPEGDSAMLDIKNVTLISGQDASELSNDQIFTMIANTEKQIKKLQEIEAKPKALEAKIKTLKEGIENLVKIVDSRD